MELIDKIFWGVFGRELGAEEKGRIYMQESAKIDINGINDNHHTIRTFLEEEGLDSRWPAFLKGLYKEQDRLATESGRVYCDECAGYYMPHEH